MTSNQTSLKYMPVTLVVPVLNREILVQRCLQSIEAQDIRPLNVILVDNGSDDGTLEVLERWAHDMEAEDIHVKVLTEPTRGASVARNAGLNLVETQWVMFFDSDDSLSHNHISRLCEQIRRNPEADMIGWNTLMHFPDGHKKKKKFPTRNYYKRALFKGDMSTVMYAVSTAIAREAGGWNNRLGCWDDVEFAIRLLKKKPIIKILENQWVDVFVCDDSITGPNFNSRADECLATLSEIERFYPLDNEHDVELKRVILAGRITWEGSPRGDGIFMDIIKKATGKRHRLALRMAYAWVSRGYPGIANIFHPLALI